MAHSSDTNEIPLRRLDPLPNGVRLGGPVLTVIGLIVFIAALMTDPARAWHSYLFNWIWAFGIAQGAVVLAAVATIAKGLWARPLRRFAVSWAAFLPIGFLLMLPIILFGAEHIFPWIEHPVHGKEAYLNIPFLTVRNVLAVGALVGVSLHFAYVTLRPDLGTMRDGIDARLHPLYMRLTRGWRGQEPEEFQAYKKLTVLSPVLVLLYALGFTFIGWDFFMSLEPHWFSTLFGPFLFVGAFLGGIALTIVVAVLYSRQQGFAGVVPPSGFHDLGKMFLGLTIFWAYLFFSHYIVIWYGKLPLEQEYLIHRLVMPFRITSSMVFFMIFVIPFFGMLSVSAKKHTSILLTFAIISLLGLWLERWTLVYPSLYIGTETLPFGWREIGMLPLFLGLMLMAHGWFASRFPMYQAWQPLSEVELQGIEYDPSGS